MHMLSASPVTAHDAFVACLHQVLAVRGCNASPCLADLALSTADGRFFRTQLASLAEALGCRIDVIVPETRAGLAWSTHPEPGDLSDAQILFLHRIRQAVLDGRSVIVRTRPLWSRLLGWNDNLPLIPFETGACGADVSVERPYETDCAVIVS